MGINGIPISDISPCLETQATHWLPSFMLIRVTLLHSTPLPWHPWTTGMACLGHVLGKRGWICASLSIECYMQWASLLVLGTSHSENLVSFKKTIKLSSEEPQIAARVRGDVDK